MVQYRHDERAARVRGTARRRDRALEQPRRFAEVKHALGISSDAQTHSLLARLRAQGLVERVERGLYRRVGPSRVVPLGIPGGALPGALPPAQICAGLGNCPLDPACSE
jgi:hypothetical protein